MPVAIEVEHFPTEVGYDTDLQSARQLHVPLTLELSVALFCVTKLHILEWPFIVPQHKVHLCNEHAVNHLLDMPHLSGGWIIMAKEKC